MTLNRRTGSGSDLADTLNSTAITGGILKAMEQREVVSEVGKPQMAALPSGGEAVTSIRIPGKCEVLLTKSVSML